MEHGAQEDWTDLGPGDRVTVIPQQGQECPGIAHSKMPNSGVIWILRITPTSGEPTITGKASFWSLQGVREPLGGMTACATN